MTLQLIQVLEGTNHALGEAAEEEDEDVDGDSNVGDEAHDLVPVADPARALRKVAASILRDVLHLDGDFEQIGQE